MKLLDSLEFLRPKPNPFRLIRVGGKKDGGYLIPDDLSGVGRCFSPGAENRKEFEDELLDGWGIASHIADASSNEGSFATPLSQRQTFEKKWIASADGSESLTLSNWVLNHEEDGLAEPGADLILQMDIEGSEYGVLAATQMDIIERFRVLVIEFHYLEKLADLEWFESTLRPALEILWKSHTVVHLHPNNCCRPVHLKQLGISVPPVLEVTLLRNDRFSLRRESRKVLVPHPQDILYNVATEPPNPIGREWLEDPRPLASWLRLGFDVVRYRARKEIRRRRKIPRG